MSDSYDKNHEHAIVDVVDDSIVTCSHPPLAFASQESASGRWTWILREQGDDTLHAVTRARIEFAKLSGGGG